MGDGSLRILHLVDDGRAGGPPIRIRRVHEALQYCSKRVVETYVACPPIEPSDFFDEAGIHHVPVRWTKPKMSSPLVSGFRWIFRALTTDLVRAARVIACVKPEVVHVNGAILIAGPLAARMVGVPAVWHLNDTLVPRIMGLPVRLLGRVTRSRLVASSGTVVQYFGLPPDTTVLYPPIPLVEEKKEQPYTARIHEPVIGVMASLHQSKRVHDLIDALPIIHDTIPGARLEVAGRMLATQRPYYDSLLSRVQKLGLDSHVRFLGFVREPLSWLRNIDILVSASRSESAGLAVMEAMGCGTPVLAARIPATEEIAGEAALLYPVEDVRALAEGILHILHHPAEANRRIQKGLERATNLYSADAIAKRHLRLYGSAMELRNSSSPAT